MVNQWVIVLGGVMNRPQGFLFLFCLICYGQAFSSTWPNEPAGSQMLVDCPFDGNVCNGSGDAPAYANDPTAPLSGPGVLDNYLAANAVYGNSREWFGMRGEKELFLGTWWKTNPEFQGYYVNGNKLIVFTGNTGQGYLYWIGPQDQPKVINMVINSQSWDNCHIWSGPECSFDMGFQPNLGNSSDATIAAGSGWHRLEVYQKCSSTASSKDGIFRWWVDGKLVGNYTNINYMPEGFAQVTITHTWDGQPSATCAHRDCSRAWHHYFDHMKISVPNCGSGGCPVTIPVGITTGSLPSAQQGKAYTATLQATGGTAPYGWTITGGSLHQGLTLNKTTGVISGTPTSCGKTEFTVKVLDSSVPAKEATRTLSIIASGTNCGSGIGRMQELADAGSQLSVRTRNRSIAFHMAQGAPSTISVYDLSGREIWRHTGTGGAVWNHGGKLTKGVYLVRTEQNGKILTASYCHVW